MEKVIDIEAILRSRLGARARFVPRFVYAWLRKLVHEDFCNEFLRHGYQGVEFCEKTIEYLGVKVDVEGLENLPPKDSPYCTFVSNHPLGAIDGVTLGAVLGRRYDGQIKYLVNDFLMNLPGLAPLCVPVNKVGRQAHNLSEMVEQIFTGPNHVIMFPAGLCSRRIDGVVQDLPWTKSFIVKSRAHQHDVVPIHFIGQNSNRFYRVANFCKRFHLPNFAMALLPDEMYRSRGNHYTVRIGRPISWKTFDKSKKPVEWAQFVREEVYKI